jgi:transposase
MLLSAKMAKGVNIPTEERAKIVAMHDLGYPLSKIGEKVHRSKASVYNVVKTYRKTGNMHPKLRGGSKRKTTPRADRKIVNLALNNRRATLEGLGNTVRNQFGINVCDKTVQRRLHEAKLYGRAARKKPLLMKRHREARLKWCRDKRKWTDAQWKKVIWSDESKFCLIGSRGCQRVWRRSGEALKPECVNSTVKHGGGKYSPKTYSFNHYDMYLSD